MNGVISALKMGLIRERIFFSFIYGVISGLRRGRLIRERKIKTTVWAVDNDPASIVVLLHVCLTVWAYHFYLYKGIFILKKLNVKL
ncbi:MAG: hypothetical protein DRQ24_11220 [Candidatus Latescibacterota bacterium]|nr:MAG: hypothetical protein DRQ24_11220 [Candidatus Latescibacterota bacterium]